MVDLQCTLTGRVFYIAADMGNIRGRPGCWTGRGQHGQQLTIKRWWWAFDAAVSLGRTAHTHTYTGGIVVPPYMRVRARRGRTASARNVERSLGRRISETSGCDSPCVALSPTWKYLKERRISSWSMDNCSRLVIELAAVRHRHSSSSRREMKNSVALFFKKVEHFQRVLCIRINIR